MANQHRSKTSSRFCRSTESTRQTSEPELLKLVETSKKRRRTVTLTCHPWFGALPRMNRFTFYLHIERQGAKVSHTIQPSTEVQIKTHLRSRPLHSSLGTGVRSRCQTTHPCYRVAMPRTVASCNNSFYLTAFKPPEASERRSTRIWHHLRAALQSSMQPCRPLGWPRRDEVSLPHLETTSQVG